NAQSTSGGTARAGAGLNHEYNQASSRTNASNSNAYENASWGTASYDTYATGNAAAQLPNRSQSNSSPLYSTQTSSATFGRLSVPEQNAQSQNMTGYAAQSYPGSRQTTATPSTATYQYPQAQVQAQTHVTQQPQRYNSPLQSVQAQQTQNRQASRAAAHQPSPHTAAVQAQSQRQQSGSVEPLPNNATVNPSQVYDDRADRQRQAKIDADRRKKREEEQAARKAEEERVAQQAEEERAAVEKRKADEDMQKSEAEAAKKKAEYERKAEQRKAARDEKRQSKSAAATLQRMASAGGPSTGEEGPPLNAEEVEM
ncbi:hypothetical protein LTR53_018202, partial [Teratosphaeriaceae sp. CCFEE 6253]